MPPGGPTRGGPLRPAGAAGASRVAPWLALAAVVLATSLPGLPQAQGAGKPEPPAGRREAPGTERSEYLWSKTVRGDFGEVVETVKQTVARQNFPVGQVLDYEMSFGRRLRQLGGGQLPFRHYKVVEFCNVSLAIRSLAADPRMGVFLPCRMVVYQLTEGGPITLLAVNPRFMPAVLHNEKLQPIAARVEELIREIFDAMDF